jgi:hypothetical protein
MTTVEILGPSDVLHEFEDIEPFAVQVKRKPRTILRWMNEPNGLPYTKIGNRRLIHIPTARRWMMERMHFPNPERITDFCLEGPGRRSQPPNQGSETAGIACRSQRSRLAAKSLR